MKFPLEINVFKQKKVNLDKNLKQIIVTYLGMAKIMKVVFNDKFGETSEKILH